MSLKVLKKPEFFLSCKESRIENPQSFYGCFYLGPFNTGQSLTVANTLRRILLSEIPGLAITSTLIQGASHEYATLKGVQDSTLDIVLNLKEIVLKSRFSIRKPVFGYIESKGPGIVRACDIKLPCFIQCVNPNQYIATLTETGLLKVKVVIQEGKNYQIANYKKIDIHSGNMEQNASLNENNAKSILKTEKCLNSSIGESKSLSTSSDFIENQEILVDAVFMPVTKVNYSIENYELGNIKRLNQIIVLEIWTNGSITPRQALYLGLNQSNMLFSQLQKMKVVHSITANSLLLQKKAI